MTGFRMRSLKSRLAGIFTGSSGFSLVELLVALSVLVIIVFAFTPLLLGSIERIYFAGDKSEALHRSQSEMEFKLVERGTVDGYELIMDFGRQARPLSTFPAAWSRSKTEGKAGAWLSSFVPFVPTINLYLARCLWPKAASTPSSSWAAARSFRKWISSSFSTATERRSIPLS